MAFAENLKRLREQNGLTQEELAKKADVTQQAIGNFEKDKIKPNAITAVLNIFFNDVHELEQAVDDYYSLFSVPNLWLKSLCSFDFHI